jgi:asparagine synthase (glutamine-hydrolysing)
MSGIVGIYNSNGKPVSQASLHRMTDVLVHRGPDGSAVWYSGAVGLGHRMLHTTPESLHEVLPLANPAADLVITADARIDNRGELIALLDPKNRPCGEIADSEIILMAYEKWGDRCPEKLLGDFAFAIWDGRRRQVFCARDPMGIKPFYYYYAAGTFVFASEIKAILSLEEVPRKLNEVKVGDYLVPVFRDQVSSYYQDIFRLPPAHIMTVAGGKVEFRSYWRLDPSRELHLGSDEEYVEAFRELFIDAVRCRLRSAFAVGSTLSGGLDSSSIACTASKLRAQDGRSRLHTFSAIFPSIVEEDPRIDERRYMEAVLSSGIFEPHYVHADRCQPLADVALHKDEAWPAPSLYLSRALFKSAHRHGVRVLLSGFDGDVVVSYGYEYLEELARSGKWADFSREAQALAERRPSTSAVRYLQQYGIPSLTELGRSWRCWAFAKQVGEISAHFDLSRRRILWDAGFKPLVQTSVRRVSRCYQGRSRRIASSWSLNTAINPLFAQRIGLAERLRAFDARDFTSQNPLREQHMFALTDGGLEYVANVFDQTAATLSVEQRYPFFDRRVIEFCLALPLKQKLWNGWTRAIFRRAMENILPPAVQWRLSKGNLSVNVRRRLLEERETLDEVILHDPKVIEPYIDIPALRGAYYRYLSAPAVTSETDLFTVFLSANLALWLRQSGLTPSAASQTS